MKKEVFVDGYKQLNIEKDQKQFLKTIKELKPYLEKFKKESVIKAKNYLLNCKIKSNKC